MIEIVEMQDEDVLGFKVDGKMDKVDLQIEQTDFELSCHLLERIRARFYFSRTSAIVIRSFSLVKGFAKNSFTFSSLFLVC